MQIFFTYSVCRFNKNVQIIATKGENWSNIANEATYIELKLILSS